MSAIGRISSIRTKLLWAGVISLGTIGFGVVALSRGESLNAAWLVIAAVCIYFIAYRVATFCKPGELECKAIDKELMCRMQQIAQVNQAKNAAAQ